MKNEDDIKPEAFKDWFGRSADDSYTFRNDTNKSINWETRYHNFSDFLLGSTNSPKEAARLLNSMFNMMGVNKRDQLTNKLEVAAKGGDRSILLPVDLLNDELHEGIAAGKRSDAFLGGALRNAAVNAFESHDNAQAVQLARFKAAKEKEIAPAERVAAMFETILHDERTDRKVADKFPGYSRFISKYKEFKFETKFEKKTDFKNDAEEFMDLMMRMIQHPGTVEQEELDKHAEHVDQMRDLMDYYGGIPETYRDTAALSSRIASYIINMLPPPEEEPPSGGGGGEGEGEGEGGEGGTPPPGMEEALSEMAKSYAESMLSESESGSEASESIMKSMENEMEEGGRIRKDDEGCKPEKVFWIKQHNNRPNYERVLGTIDRAKASTVANLLKRKSRDFKFSIRGMRSGRLDTNKLVEARQHVPTVYERMGEVKTDKLAVCVLIDESGSMSGTKIEKARQAAVFLNEAFGKQPDVELFIYGHTADDDHGTGTCEISIYREPGFINKHALGEVRARSNNRDGQAIIEVAKRVRGFTRNSVVLIVISDGQPAASGYGGRIGIEHTRKMVLKAEALGMQVIQIAIDSVDSRKMFKNFVNMKDMKTFPADLVNFLRVRINKTIKEHITIH